MKRLGTFLGWLENGCIFLCFSVTLTILSISIMSRYVFRRPLSWPDELTTYLFILMTFMGACAAVKWDSELKVNALYERFPQWRFGLDLILNLVRLLACVIFIVLGIKFVIVAWEMQTFSPILRVPVYVIFSMLPFFGVVMGLRTVECLVNLFKGR